jgi:hypothetical protein
MGLKLSTAIAYKEPIAWPMPPADVDFVPKRQTPEQFADSLINDAIDGSRRGLTEVRGRGDKFQTENYQVALIPLPHSINQSEVEGPVLARMDSVLVLPVTWKDLITRLRAEGGTSTSYQPQDVAAFGVVSVKLSSMEVWHAGQPVTLTPLEFKLLRYFLAHPVKVISRDELLNEVWGFDNYPCTRTVDSHMWRLRRKLEVDPANPVHFHTVHAMGYKFLP